MNKITEDDFDENRLFNIPQSHQPVAAPWVPPVEPMTEKPLKKYYRLPGLHVHLPTNGAFMPPGTIQLSMNNDVPVFPMRAADEMLLKSPDALMSGYAIEQLIKSCVPNILAPRFISTPDLDVVLLAIRAATYGETMKLHAACPKCGHINDIDCHLPQILSTMKSIDPVNVVRLSDDVLVYIRPYSLLNATKASNVSFEETRKMQAFEDDDEGRKAQMNKSMARLAALNIELLADCIIKVVIPGEEVTDKKEILEFIDNISRVWVSKIEEKLKEINTKGIDKTTKISCDGVDENNILCSHTWETEVEFDPANFFDGTS